MIKSFILLSLALLLVHANVSVTESSPLGPKCTSPLTPTNPSTMWIQTINHQGTAPFNGNPSSYPIYRNVKDYGAKGDGVTDDTAAINAAVSAGNRCGLGCDSSTVAPALVFFPQGTYLISTPIIMYYFTQMIGDAVNPPTLLATPSFSGIAVLDSDPYLAGGANWYTNQNNFYRQVRNFIIDLTHVNGGATGIHWQVAQATSLTNIVFQMSQDSGSQHQGIFMENGSGGFFSDLIFNGGKLGMWIGNQQFTARNITVNNAQTAIYVGWDWAWTFKDLYINNCSLGVDISAGGAGAEGVGSVIILDAVITNTPVGINTVTSASSQPKSGGSLILDNVQFTNVPAAVKDVATGAVILNGPGSGQTTTVQSWGQGQFYNNSSAGGSFNQGNLNPPTKASAILANGANTIFARPRPQYEEYDVSSFVSVKDNGAKGDGKTDDTTAIQNVLNQYAGCKIIYFPAGIYILTNTVTIPAGSKIVGETWSVLLATGSNFADESELIPMVKVGNSGDTGSVEISDILFSTQGPVPGAVLVEWNIRDPQGQQGASAMWDSHFRLGGALGTNLETAQCVKQSGVSSDCNAAFLAFHLTASSSAYLENVWVWTADHNLDGDHSQLSIYNGRGILIESSNGPVWMYGTASEHHVMYQYNIVNAQNIFMGMIQIETPYYQTVPKAPVPFATNTQYNDPSFANCPSNSATCAMAWGFRVVNSQNIYLYGAGLYSFFQNYDQTCLQSEHCQDAMVSLEGNNSELYIYNLNTKGSNSMLDVNGSSLILQADNRNGFCATVAGVLAESGMSNNQFWIGERNFLG